MFIDLKTITKEEKEEILTININNIMIICPVTLENDLRIHSAVVFRSGVKVHFIETREEIKTLLKEANDK